MPKIYFLSLPGELRNRIYGLCTPLTAHVEEFSGLRSASKQIRAEYETEAVRTMRKYLETIEKNWPHSQELRITPPEKFSELADVTILLPVSLYFPQRGIDSFEDWVLDDHGNSKTMDTSLAPLFSVHLSSLTIGYHDDSNGLVRYDYHLVPQGLLQDITNVLVIRPTSPARGSTHERQEYAQRMKRKFRLEGGLHVRKVAYKWFKSQHTAEYMMNVEWEHIRFFLREEWWWREGPNAKTLVSNWGRGDDNVYLDIL
jgi:hypothetical protein